MDRDLGLLGRQLLKGALERVKKPAAVEGFVVSLGNIF